MLYPLLVNFVGILVCLFTTCCFFIKIVKSLFLCELAEDLSLKSMEGMERCLGNYALLLLVSFLERGKVYRGQNSVVHGSVEMAWEQTHLRCVKLVTSLTQQGFSCGDVIEILVPDIPAMQELHFPMAGTITCTLNMRYDSFMISILLQRCEAKIIFAYQFLHIVQGAFYILAKLNRKSLILVLIPEQDTPSPSSSVSPIMDKYSSVTYAFQLVSATLVVEDENPKIPVKYVRVYVYAPEQFPEEVVFFCVHTLGRSRPDHNEWDKPKTKYTKDGMEPHRGQSWTVQWLNFDNFYIKDAIEKKIEDLLVLSSEFVMFEDPSFKEYAENDIGQSKKLEGNKPMVLDFVDDITPRHVVCYVNYMRVVGTRLFQGGNIVMDSAMGLVDRFNKY